jgi:hypothetical protein
MPNTFGALAFCTQQVTTRLQSGEAATAGEEGANRTVARQSSRAAPAGVHHGGPRGAHAVTNRIFRLEARRQPFAGRLLR